MTLISQLSRSVRVGDGSKPRKLRKKEPTFIMVTPPRTPHATARKTVDAKQTKPTFLQKLKDKANRVKGRLLRKRAGEDSGSMSDRKAKLPSPTGPQTDTTEPVSASRTPDFEDELAAAIDDGSTRVFRAKTARTNEEEVDHDGISAQGTTDDTAGNRARSGCVRQSQVELGCSTVDVAAQKALAKPRSDAQEGPSSRAKDVFMDRASSVSPNPNQSCQGKEEVIQVIEKANPSPESLVKHTYMTDESSSRGDAGSVTRALFQDEEAESTERQKSAMCCHCAEEFNEFKKGYAVEKEIMKNELELLQQLGGNEYRLVKKVQSLIQECRILNMERKRVEDKLWDLAAEKEHHEKTIDQLRQQLEQEKQASGKEICDAKQHHEDPDAELEKLKMAIIAEGSLCTTSKTSPQNRDTVTPRAKPRLGPSPLRASCE